MQVYTHVLKTRNVRSAHVTSARALSNNGFRRDFNHLYFWHFKRFLLHSIDILLSPIGDLTNIHKNFLTALPERKNCLTSILVGGDGEPQTYLVYAVETTEDEKQTGSKTFPYRCTFCPGFMALIFFAMFAILRKLQ